MRSLICVLFILMISSCIPIRIAPTIKEDKIMKASKFKRKLPKQYAFIFEDPKEADEFYNYVNTKFQLDHQDVDWGVPFEIDNIVYYMSFYESEIPNKTFNLIPFLIDAKRDSNGNSPLFDGSYVSRYGNWYIVITVNNDVSTDCLYPEYENRHKIISYLKELRKEYVNTYNYEEVLLKQKSPN